MPFTVSHAAAVLPFRRTRLPWSALVIGSFGPDFEYFLRMHFNDREWHYFPWIVTYALPFTLLVYFLFHLFIKDPIIDLLPDGFQRRFHPEHDPYPHSVRDWVLLLSALCIGLATHRIWDDFTHDYTWPWRHIAFLRSEITFHHHRVQQGYAVLQGLSTLAGLFILFIALIVWYHRTPPDHPVNPHIPLLLKVAFFIFVPVVSFVGGDMRAHQIIGVPHSMTKHNEFFLTFVIACISCFLWQLIAYGICATLWHKAKGTHR
ncbi:MAG TPA: DUF4184 family protein [Candidatus Koribacter sp.]|jgi:hypothetical protein